MSRDNEHCAVNRCRRPTILLYYDRYPVCERCWERHCEGKINLKTEFGILPMPPDELAAIQARHMKTSPTPS